MPTANMRIEQITVRRDEALTVWIYPEADSNSGVQMEVRVTPYGAVELFCDQWHKVYRFPFDQWHPRDSDTACTGA
jgi:1,2-phenylacetyl-CoA epoxidase PaaB subunit